VRGRSTPIPPPVVGHCAPDAVPHAPLNLHPVSFADLDVPTVRHGKRSIRWADEPEDVRAEVKQAAIEQLTFRLQVAKRVAVLNPGLDNVERIEHLERAIAAAGRL